MQSPGKIINSNICTVGRPGYYMVSNSIYKLMLSKNNKFLPLLLYFCSHIELLNTYI